MAGTMRNGRLLVSQTGGESSHAWRWFLVQCPNRSDRRGLAFLWLKNFGRGAEVDFACVHQRFAQRWVRVNRFGDVVHFATHFDRQHRFGDQFAGA